MGESSSFCRDVGWNSGQVCRDGGADVFSHDHGCCTGEVDPSLGRHNQRDGNCGAGGLHNNGEYRSHDQEKESGKNPHSGEVLNKGKHFRVVLQIGHGGLQKIETHKKKGEPEYEFTHRFVSAFGGEDQWQRDTHQRNGQRTDREFTEAEKGDNPGRDRGTNIGTHNHPNRLNQTQQSGIDKTHHHDGGRRGGLYQGGDHHTCQYAHDAVLCHG